MTVRDRNGAGIAIGCPVLQRYPHREALAREPFRGRVVLIQNIDDETVILYREEHTEHTRCGNLDTVEYDWSRPPTANMERD